MSDMPAAGTFLFFLVLLAVAAIGKPLADKLRLPFPVLLVIIGFAGSEFATRMLDVDTGITWQNLKTIIFFGLIPILIFHAASVINPERLRSELAMVLLLALPLMLVSVAIIAVLLYSGIDHSGFPWIAALIAGALLSATDPAAVIALLERTNVSERLTLLLEGESLLNDATAILLFTLLIEIATSGQAAEGIWINSVIRFLSVFLGGLAVGVIIAILAGLLLRLTRGHNLHGLISLVSVYAAFLLSESVLHLSGVMAVLAVGLVFGHLGRSKLYDQQTTEGFWSVLSGLAEILIFLLAGVTIIPAMFTDQWLAMLLGIGAVLIARAVAVYGGLSLVGALSDRQRLTWGDGTVLYWGGVRGTVTLALALSIPLTLDYWYSIQSIAYGVVLFTLFVQATTMSPLIRKLG